MSSNKLHNRVSLVKHTQKGAITAPFCDLAVIVPLAQAIGLLDANASELIAVLEPGEHRPYTEFLAGRTWAEDVSYVDFKEEGGHMQFGPVYQIFQDFSSRKYPHGRTLFVGKTETATGIFATVIEQQDRLCEDGSYEPLKMEKHKVAHDTYEKYGIEALTQYHYLAQLLMGAKYALQTEPDGIVIRACSPALAIEKWNLHIGQQAQIAAGVKYEDVIAQSRALLDAMMDRVDAEMGINATMRQRVLKTAEKSAVTYEEAAQFVLNGVVPQA